MGFLISKKKEKLSAEIEVTILYVIAVNALLVWLRGIFNVSLLCNKLYSIIYGLFVSKGLCVRMILLYISPNICELGIFHSGVVGVFLRNNTSVTNRCALIDSDVIMAEW